MNPAALLAGPKQLGPVEWIVGVSGIALVVAAVANVNPLGLVREAFGGPKAGPLYTPKPKGGITPITDLPGTNPPGAGEPELADLPGHSGHRLTPAAVQSFGVVETLYGRPIPITDSYRSYALQLKRWQEEPGRFVHPDKSAHVRGTAVDVNLPALGLAGNKGEPGFDALVRAFEASSWCLSAYDKGEPWHFSHGECR